MKVRKFRLLLMILAVMIVGVLGKDFISTGKGIVYAATATKEAGSFSTFQKEPEDDGFQDIGGVRLYTLDGKAPKENNQPTEEDIDSAMEAVSMRTGAIASRDWYSYSSKYFFQSLNNEQKKLYKDMYAYCMYYLVTEDANSESPANYTTTQITLNGKIVNESLTKFFKYSTYSISSMDAADVLLVFLYENPQFYFLDNGAILLGDGSGFCLTLFDIFGDSRSRADMTEKIFNKVDSYAAQVAAQKTDYDKVKKAHDLLCENNTYAFSGNLGLPEMYDQSIYSSIIMQKTVCAGYSKGAEAILRKAGIPAICVTSTDKGYHAWNMVKVGANWYNLDITWDDEKEENPYDVRIPFTLNYFMLVSDKNVVKYDYDLKGNPKESHKYKEIWGYLTKPVSLNNYSASTYMNSNNSTALPDYNAKGELNSVYLPEVKPVITLAAKKFAYTGSVIKPAVTAVKAGGYAMDASKYTVTYTSAKKVGKYKVTVTMNPSSGYTGSAKAEFTIVPKKTSLKKVSSGSGTIKVKVKKVSSQATGYQIQVSTKKSFKSKKTAWLKNYKKTSKTISGLKSGKKYYVRVRTYKTVKGKKYYSEWSKVKKVKVK
ncbi:MAG: hypothetical protein J6M65_01370 [Eubacterium sp.]|nr:hypothetical protein [Eubacterium sp.]